MLIDAHVHVFPKVDGYGPKGHTHSAGYGRIDFGDGIAQDVLPAINENTSHTVQMLLREMQTEIMSVQDAEKYFPHVPIYK